MLPFASGSVKYLPKIFEEQHRGEEAAVTATEAISINFLVVFICFLCLHTPHPKCIIKGSIYQELLLVLACFAVQCKTK